MNMKMDGLQRTFQKNKNDVKTLIALRDELTYRSTRQANRLRESIEAVLDEVQNNKPPKNPELPGLDTNSQTKTTTQNTTHAQKTASRGGTTTKKASGGTSTAKLDRSKAPDDVLPFDDIKKPDIFTGMRAPGSGGRFRDAYLRPLKDNLTLKIDPTVDRTGAYVEALDALISEIRQKGAGQTRIELGPGQKMTAESGALLYTFDLRSEAELFEDAQVELEVDGNRQPATIVSIQNGQITVSVEHEIAAQPSGGALISDNTAFLEALKQKLEEVKKGDISLNTDLANAVVDGTTPPTPANEIVPSDLSKDLNEAQQAAYQKSLKQGVTYIWGPPGCGKTQTLAPTVQTAFEARHRILVCSNTNKAVDQVIYRICESLGRDNSAMRDGRILRLGRIADAKLDHAYRDFVTEDGIVARLSDDLQRRRNELSEEIAKIDRSVEDARKTVERFQRLDAIADETEKARKQAQKVENDRKQARQAAQTEDDQLAVLNAELNGKGGKLFGLIKRSRAEIERDIRGCRERLDQKRKRADDLDKQAAEIEETLQKLSSEKADLTRLTQRANRAAAERALEEANDRRDPLVTEQREIDTKLSNLRDDIKRNAAVVGTTGTRAYLSHKDLGQFDLVIVDEASMMLLPAAWFVAGMARERVVICGDFRQVAPIVQTEQRAIIKVIGHDVFQASGNDDPESPSLALLDQQYRMDDAICRLISGPMYKGRLKTAAERKPAERVQPPEPFDPPIMVVDTSRLWPFESTNAVGSRFNLMHALLVRNLVWHFGRNGVIENHGSLGVCTAYRAQGDLIKQLVAGTGHENVQVGTVHSFQGDERGTVIFDVPEGNGGWYLGQFTQGLAPDWPGARVLNVAFSRAENHLILLANLTYLDSHLPEHALLRDVLYRIQDKGKVIDAEEVLALRPIKKDLQGLLQRVPLDVETGNLGIFNQSNFLPAFEADIDSAKRSIVILSGFITPTRVGQLGDRLRSKINDGVAVRCVTRPPDRNGSIPPELGEQALQSLEQIGCVVDCRDAIHEKIVLIDEEIVWHGSLNVLSHTHLTDESMSRIYDGGFARAVAASITKRKVAPDKAVAGLTSAENPKCARCGGRTSYKTGKHGPFFRCTTTGCDWKANLDQVDKGHVRDMDPTGPPCPKCNSETHIRNGRNGPFYGCSRYPKCNGTVNVKKSSRKTTQKRQKAS